MNVIYALGDQSYKNVVKIGLDSNWPNRFEQARSHNARPVVVYGVWEFNSMQELRDAENKVAGTLSSFQRKDTHGREWYDLSPQDAVATLAKNNVLPGKMLLDPNPKVKSRDLPYDDWRKQSDEFKGQVYKRILWVFEEQSPEKRLKVIHSPLYDTCYQYAFTYNPFPVFLVDAYHHPLMTNGPSFTLRNGNESVRETWESLVKDSAKGPGLKATNVGWLNPGVGRLCVQDVATQFGLVRYDLRSPKPTCVRPNDGYGAKEIPYGSVPPLRRVKD